MESFDEIIHQSTRLKIMSALMALSAGDSLDFSSLIKMLNLSDGNLGAHIQKLEEAGYIAVQKTFVDRKPRTFLQATSKGKHRFEEHVKALKAIVGGEKV
jgi:DNA-binding MarR family transcriptional regulator